MPIRKTCRNKGISSIMAAVAATLLILLSLNAFFAVIYSSDLYTGTREERNRREWERESERLRIVSLSIDNNKPNATLINEGAVPIELADLWVTNLTGGVPSTHTVYGLFQNCSAKAACSIIIPPASYKTNVGQDLYNNTGRVPDTRARVFNSLQTYEIQIYTKRGNYAEATYVPATPQTGVGPFYFSFDKQSFNYTTSNAGGGPAWEILCTSSNPKNNIIFRVKFTNHGDRDIEISYLSYMMVVSPQISDSTSYVENEYYYFVLNNTSTSTHPVNYTDYSQDVPANPQNKEVGVTQVVEFGGIKPGSATLQSFPVPYAASSQYGKDRDSLYTVWIAIFWRWKGTTQYYGIYVAFNGIHVRSS